MYNSKIDNNPYRQSAPQHTNTYSNQQVRPPSQPNAPWQQQFHTFQQNNSETQYIKPQKQKRDIANSRVNNRANQDSQLYTAHQPYHYVPRLQSQNNEMFQRRVQRPGENVERNYGVERSFGMDSHNVNDSTKSLASFYEGTNPIGMQQQHDFMDTRSQTYTFKNKKDDLNDRLNAQDRRTTSVNGSMPIHEYNPYLDMRPQNTSDIQYTHL
jgi:hypothetical protein